MTIRPLERSGSSANITYYRERGAREDEGFVWAQVLFSLPWQRGTDGTIGVDPDRRPSYHVTVFRTGKGEVATARYEPAGTPPELPARTVTRLVREALKAES